MQHVSRLLLVLAFLTSSCDSSPGGDVDLLLLKAASAGDISAARKQIRRKADVNYQYGEYKISPLMIAAMRGRKDVFGLLLDSGADPNLTDNDGATAGNYLGLARDHVPEEELKAMGELFRSKGGTIKDMGGLELLLFVGSKPLSPKCYDFETSPCGA